MIFIKKDLKNWFWNGSRQYFWIWPDLEPIDGSWTRLKGGSLPGNQSKKALAILLKHKAINPSRIMPEAF